ncbi:MAG: ComEC/Rec2 family competence protein, partial [Pseudomonadales bacterium]
GVAVLIAVAMGWRRPRTAWPLPWCLGLMVGFGWSALAHQRALDERIPDVGGDALPLEVVVAAEPVPSPAAAGRPPALRLLVRVAGGPLSDRRLRLTWYGAPAVAAGDRWMLRAVVRPPWSYANPSGFDYERWLLASGIHGTGYVRSGRLLEPAPSGILTHTRSALAAHLGSPDLAHGPVLSALLLGRSGGIDDGLWDRFRATGTVHLMVISGLHVSLAAGLGYLLGRLAASALPLLLLYANARTAGALAGLAAATAYVLLAGAGLPGQRALVMAACAMALLVWGRSGQLASGLLVALAVVLAIHPLAIHLQGFWLSFGAVTVLLLVLGPRRRRPLRLPGAGAALRLLQAQVALSVGMLPLLALQTGELSWTAAPANLVAVPVVSIGVVPALLYGALLAGPWPAAADVAFALADGLLGIALAWVDWLAARPPLPVAAGPAARVCAQAGALGCLLGPPRRWLPVLALVALLLFSGRPADLRPGEYRLTVLDVGQGDAVLVDTRHHRLLFDTGPAYPSGFDAGAAVVVPNVVATGRPAIDLLLVSHDDVDHAGGLGSVLGRLAVTARLGSAAGDGAHACHGRAWRWDGVRFSVLALPRPPGASTNDRSCVLLIDNGRERALLPADVSHRVEKELVRALNGPVRVLMAPHHGSATSSSRLLTRVARPELVLVSAGRRNRFGHPHPRVVARYRDVDAQVYVTGDHGALQWSSAHPERMISFRRDRAPFWRSAG